MTLAQRSPQHVAIARSVFSGQNPLAARADRAFGPPCRGLLPPLHQAKAESNNSFPPAAHHPSLRHASIFSSPMVSDAQGGSRGCLRRRTWPAHYHAKGTPARSVKPNSHELMRIGIPDQLRVRSGVCRWLGQYSPAMEKMIPCQPKPPGLECERLGMGPGRLKGASQDDQTREFWER